ncbi:MAG: lysine--tRNA ligase [Candidatus Marinimicrobia bacterium]|jgi:lysyl-tRNA synthetase class 2|nr:lysine--tRNA ligase [Candidatus Neomarinimicrobiota bacterium]MBT5440475.1 lysine--tRNA ligase [Candidatus Neomarinimicrobiota bacterium]MDG2366944.1 lysine--tRNA ligase [Candidatus Neomarinimicrobiota bacterium]|tara:strand:- start:18011 stop:19501 length:1491 start_codon:yes stop_codon:yes gene_type:complete
MSEEHKSLNQIIDYRKEKLSKLKEAGIDPYPQKFTPNQFSREIINNFENFQDKDVIIAGRIMSIRKMGKASFFHLQDQFGKIQAFIKRDNIGDENYNNFKLLDIGDFVGIEGYVFKTKVGEISIHVKVLTILCKSIRPLPIVKEKEGEEFDAFIDKENRYRNRHLDLIVNPNNKEIFIKRSKIIKGLRYFLDKMDFLEVETPVLQPIYGGANARPFTTHHNALDQKLYLRIADELYLKRLIIGGFDRVYEIAKDFRNEGMDRNHNPEFTMLEFYWAYADYEDNMNLVEDMFRDVAKTIGKTKIKLGEITIDLSKPFKRRPILDLLNEATGEDLTDFSEKKLRDICNSNHVDIDTNFNYGQMLDALMSELVEPALIEPTFVIDYPIAISPLAKKHRNGNLNLVERFELFIGGSEFANAFTELNDPVDQRERFQSQAKLGDDGDEEAHPIDESFLEAIECGMPPTAGVGIGVDRLVMLLTENVTIKEVILFPSMRSEE